MSEIPEEDNSALQKRKAIQSVMRDTSLTPQERNKRMQDIMRGNFQLPKETPPTPQPVPTKTADASSSVAAVPKPELVRRGSSAKELIAKFEEANKNPPPEVQHEVSFMSVHSAEGRGVGLEEVRTKNNGELDEADMLDSLHEEDLDGDDNYGDIHQKPSTDSKLTEEEKKKHAFISSKTVAKQRQVLVERIRANSSDYDLEPSKQVPSPENMQKSGGGGIKYTPKRKNNSVTLDDFEQRIREKSASGGTGSGSGSALGGNNTSTKVGASTTSKMADYESRILQKTMSTDSQDSSAGTPKRTNNSAALDTLEQRILQKSAAAGGAGAGASTSAAGSATPHKKGSVSSSTMDEYERRLLSKTRAMSMDSQGSSTYEDRLKEKSRSPSNSSDATPGASNTSSINNQLESSILEKIQANNRSSMGDDSYRSGKSDDSNSVGAFPMAATSSTSRGQRGSFDSRLAHKLTTSRTMGGGGEVDNKGRGSVASSVSALTTATGLQDDTASASAKKEAPKQEEVFDPNTKKRKAIQQIMQDHTLTPQERNTRLQAVLAGNWESSTDMMDESRRSSSGVGTAALEAKIASKLKKKEESNKETVEEEEKLDEDAGGSSPVGGSHDDDDGPGVGYGSLPRPEEHFPQDTNNAIDNSEYSDPFRDHTGLTPNQRISTLSNASDHANIDEWAETMERNTLPIDEWAEAVEEETQRDVNSGLAVAQAVAPDDEPDYVYNAIEYDPEAKPPLHRNRRFRVYTYFALIMIAIVVVLVVVYITSASKQDEIIDINIKYQDSPTITPTASPITDREASGILEQLEGGLLLRGERFVEMSRTDPRLMALDWILHKDMMQLVSDDVNLYQRYALAVLAYAMDSRAWYICGDPGKDYRVDECKITYWDNSTSTHGVWLSSTSECGWYGVTCSADGVVRALDLNYMDLVGKIPHELAALRFLQLLALPNNCLYGTIPPEIGKLHNLLSLELHGNGLSGEMPNEIYDLKNLQLLNLAEQWGGERKCTMSNNRTTVDIKYRHGGIADEERGFLKLEMNSGLTGTLGDEVGVWRAMKGLYLNKNSFVGEISEEIGKMRYLRFLWLHDNFIEGSLPETMSKLKNLRYLKLEENFIVSSFPTEMGRLTDLEWLTVSGNSMYGEIPNGLYKMKKMEILRLDNTMTREPPWMAVADEGFTGSINPLIGDMQDLKWLFLNNNPMNGTIPTELGLCEKLEIVRVHRTNIGGTMPREVCILRDKFLNSDTNAGVLYSDCMLNNNTEAPFMRCDCCSDCCDHTTGVCVADD